MKVFAVSGLHRTGKTTVVEHLVAEFASRGLKVGTIKDIHFEGFSMDKEGTNTWRHRKAGASVVAARGLDETDFVYTRRMDMSELVSRFDVDVLVIEGGHDEPYPRITCATGEEDADTRTDAFTFAYSGIMGTTMRTYRGMMVFDCTREASKLADLALVKATELPAGGHK